MPDAAYCTRAELALWGTTAAALSAIDPGDQDKAIAGASSVIDGFLGSRGTLPLLGWGLDIRRAAASIAAYDLIAGSRGRNPEESGDRDPLYDRFKATMAWLELVKDGEVTTSAVFSPVTPPAVEQPGEAQVTSNQQRGWQGGDSVFGGGGAFTGRRR